MKQIDSKTIHSVLNYHDLINALKKGFAGNYKMPQRQIYNLSDDTKQKEAVALLPSWNDEVICTKIFSYFPKNQEPLKSLYSNILLFSRTTGESLAILDGTSITYWRTAAVSALASQFLSRKNSETLLLFGTGYLASYLIAAHLSVRKLKKVIIAGRTKNNVENLINSSKQKYPEIQFIESNDLSKEIPQTDIICCATASPIPLFDGHHLAPGTHIDCLGNHSPDQRECDSYTIQNAKVYVDSRVNTLSEAGELLIPITENILTADDIIGELSELSKNSEIHRNNQSDITLFKSVGTALSDLIAAQLVYESMQND
jgi:1-pyrroline-2-carboxylate reductase [NAD(P)H]